jgi:hypothetical protein
VLVLTPSFHTGDNQENMTTIDYLLLLALGLSLHGAKGQDDAKYTIFISLQGPSTQDPREKSWNFKCNAACLGINKITENYSRSCQ